MRLAPADYTYWFVREAFGWSVVLQVLWTFDEVPDESALLEMNERLAASPLHRRVRRPSVFGARPQVERSLGVPALLLDTEPIAADEVARWAASELDTTPLDPESGPAWRLRGVETESSGFALSLTALHLVVDGRAMVSAAVAALSGPVGDPLGRRRRLPEPAGDLVDAAGQVGAAVLGTVRAVLTESVPAPDLPRRSPMHERAPKAAPAWASVTVDSAHWADIARTHGGTPNSLFVAVIAGALRRAGYAAQGDPLKIGIPVSRRPAGTDGGNHTAGVSVVLADEPTAGKDLTGVRTQCKQAFAALTAGTRPAMMHLQPLMWLLPLSVVTRVASAGSGMPDAVVSNLGEFPPELSTVGGVQATGVAFRGIAQGVDPAAPQRFGEGLQSWLVESTGDTTFTVAAFDESIFETTRLGDVLAKELSDWGIRHRVW